MVNIFRKLNFTGIIMSGLPGSGKEAIGRLLSKDFNLCRIAPCELLGKVSNEEWFKQDPSFPKIKSAIEEGNLIGEDIVFDIVHKYYLHTKNTVKGVLLDGIPRNLHQVELLKDKFDLKTFVLVNVIKSENNLIESLRVRKICNGCGRNSKIAEIHKDGYEIENRCFAEKEQCDECNGQLFMWDFDKKDIIEQRMAVYKEQTLPVMDELQKLVWKTVDFISITGKEYPALKKRVEELK